MNEPALVRLEEREGHYWITLNRPEVLNALNEPLIEDFLRAMDRVADPGRPLILTGAGRAFCAGGDLKGYLARLDDLEAMAAYFRLARQMFRRVADYPGVTIAAANGVTVAGGLELLLICDLAVAAESARFADGHLNYGLHPGGGSTSLLAPLIGERRARWLVLSGEFVDAREAERIGLVNATVPDSELEATANRMAATIARQSRSAIRRTKALMRRPFEQVLEAEHASLMEHFQDPETRRRLEEFAARSRARNQ